MPSLSVEQKAIIYTRVREHVPIRDIAEELNISKNTVLLCKSKISETGTIGRKQGSGRPKISTEVQDGGVINYLRANPFETAIKAVQETNFPGSTSTARRRIRGSDIRSRCAANKISLTEVNKNRRLDFARNYVNLNNIWETVIFSDEKTFQSCNNGKVRVYRPTGARYDEQYTHKTNMSGRFSVNIWAWISSRGPGVCEIVQERLTAPVYCNILRQTMLPTVTAVYGENFIFQHDNSPIHTSRLVQQYLQENEINVLPWPSKSPDLNPIENVWGEMTKYIYKHDFRPRNQQELLQKIRESWGLISQDYVRNLVVSMPRRLQNVINSNGSMTKY